MPRSVNLNVSGNGISQLTVIFATMYPRKVGSSHEAIIVVRDLLNACTTPSANRERLHDKMIQLDNGDNRWCIFELSMMKLSVQFFS